MQRCGTHQLEAKNSYLPEIVGNFLSGLAKYNQFHGEKCP